MTFIADMELSTAPDAADQTLPSFDGSFRQLCEQLEVVLLTACLSVLPSFYIRTSTFYQSEVAVIHSNYPYKSFAQNTRSAALYCSKYSSTLTRKTVQYFAPELELLV